MHVLTIMVFIKWSACSHMLVLACQHQQTAQSKQATECDLRTSSGTPVLLIVPGM